MKRMNIKILVVENERTRAKDITNWLKALGYTTSETASSGEEAIRKASKNPPDLVLMDTQLKGEMDSLKTAQEIRDCFDVPVVYLADYIDDNTLLQAKVTEPFEYILKPFMEKELHKSIETAIYKHKMAIVRRLIVEGN